MLYISILGILHLIGYVSFTRACVIPSYLVFRSLLPSRLLSLLRLKPITCAMVKQALVKSRNKFVTAMIFFAIAFFIDLIRMLLTPAYHSDIFVNLLIHLIGSMITALISAILLYSFDTKYPQA